MPGSVKNKIRSGTLFLFFLVVLSAGLSIYYLAKVRVQSKNILKANYESLEYALKMQKALDSMRQNFHFIDSFDKQLKQQEANITESGEREITSSLRQSFNRLQKGDSSQAQNISYNLQQVLALNMEAIKSKNERTETAGEEALTFLIGIAAIIFLVGITFVYNFPSIVTNPIQKLTEAIKAIGQKDYTHRIHIESKDEFGEMANAFNEMAERLEYFESSSLNKIIFEKTRAEAVINSLKDASIGIDKADIVLFANNQALQLLGLAAKDMVGIPVAEISRRNDLFRFLLDEKGTAPFKIVVDNRENYFTKEVMDIPQEGGNNRVIVLKNITSFKELDAAKTNFIATVSHELKTPLASSDFSLKLLVDERIGKLSDEQKELIQNLRQDNQRMLRILSELLNMSQVEAGKIQLEVSSVSPYNIADMAVNAIENTAREKNIIIQKQYAESLPNVAADAEKTGWVLNNFLTNAVKYSSDNSNIILSIKTTNNLVEFCVADKGPGIQSEYLPKVFDRFFKVPGSKRTGSGLGLAISKDFIEAEGGTIWVKSEIGYGSEFGFSLPVSA